MSLKCVKYKFFVDVLDLFINLYYCCKQTCDNAGILLQRQLYTCVSCCCLLHSRLLCSVSWNKCYVVNCMNSCGVNFDLLGLNKF